MNKRSLRLRPIVLLCSVLALPVTASVAQLTNADRIGSHDFGYQVAGSGRIRPVQVFDDGKVTFFQFPAGIEPPVIFRITESGPVPVKAVVDSFYVKVNGVANEYLLRSASASGRVVYAGLARAETPITNAAGAIATETEAQLLGKQSSTPQWSQQMASTQPVLFTPSDARPRAVDTNSYATPSKGDTVKWVQENVESEEHEFVFQKDIGKLARYQESRLQKFAMGLSGEYTVVVVGRDDEGLKEDLANTRAQYLAAALHKAGVPRGRIEIRTGGEMRSGLGWASHVRVVRKVQTEIAPSKPILLTPSMVATVAPPPPPPPPAEAPPMGFTFELSDGTISGAIKRWAQATSYQVVWELPAEADAAVTGSGKLAAGSMKDAMEQIAVGMKQKGYEMNVTIYKNRVIRFSANQ